MTTRADHIVVSRTARYYTLGGASGRPSEVYFACHGYGQLAADFARTFEVIASDDRLVVVPEALSRFYLDNSGGEHGPSSAIGATWMTREDRLAEIDDYVRYLDLLFDHVLTGLERSATRVTAIGFSQGVATVARWLAGGRARADRVVLWGSFPPEDVPLADGAFGGATLWLVAGERDRFATADRIAAERTRLRERGVRFREASFPGGHRLDDDVLRTLAADWRVGA